MGSQRVTLVTEEEKARIMEKVKEFATKHKEVTNVLQYLYVYIHKEVATVSYIYYCVLCILLCLMYTTVSDVYYCVLYILLCLIYATVSYIYYCVL